MSLITSLTTDKWHSHVPWTTAINLYSAVTFALLKCCDYSLTFRRMLPDSRSHCVNTVKALLDGPVSSSSAINTFHCLCLSFLFCATVTGPPEGRVWTPGHAEVYEQRSKSTAQGNYMAGSKDFVCVCIYEHCLQPHSWCCAILWHLFFISYLLD